MNSFQDRLHKRLEQLKAHAGPSEQQEHDPEVEEVVELAQNLQTTLHIQVRPAFAYHLQRRMLRHSAELRLQHGKSARPFFLRLFARPILVGALSLCVLLVLGTSSLLTFAARITNPSNPLYTLTRWEQNVQISLASNPQDRATLALQLARENLTALPMLAAPAQVAAYNQTLADLDQHLQTAVSALHALPANVQRQQLAEDLANLQAESIHTLHSLLSQLVLPEHLTTTVELAQLGDTVPGVLNGTLILPAHANGQATVSLSGSNLPTEAHLLINGQLTSVTGTLQNGLLIFQLTDWNGKQHPHSLGILSPDGTAAQTTTITITTAPANGKTNANGQSTTSTGKGKSQGNTNPGTGNSNAGGNGKNKKPTATPTPPH